MKVYIITGSKRGRGETIERVLSNKTMAKDEVEIRRAKGEFVGFEEHEVIEPLFENIEQIGEFSGNKDG